MRVTAVLLVLDVNDSAAAQVALAHDLEGLDRGKGAEALQRSATTACHAAVKANYPLSYEKMTHSRRAARDGTRRCALTAGPDAAADPPRDREEFPADLKAGWA